MNNLIGMIRRIVGLGVLRRDAIRNGVKFLQVQLGDDFSANDIEHLEPFGFTSRALNGADAVLLSQGGNRGKTLCIMAADRSYRIEIGEGEAAIYNRHGDKAHIRADRTIEVKTPTRVLLDTPFTEVTGDMLVHGDAQVDGDTTINGDTTMNADADVANNLTAGTASINDRSFINHTHDEHDGETTGGVN